MLRTIAIEVCPLDYDNVGRYVAVLRAMRKEFGVFWARNGYGWGYYPYTAVLVYGNIRRVRKVLKRFKFYNEIKINDKYKWGPFGADIGREKYLARIDKKNKQRRFK